MTDTRDRKPRSLFGLVGDVPRLVKELVKGELNLLKAEISQDDVAAGVCAVLGPAFARTTGAQIPIDGGNDRVI